MLITGIRCENSDMFQYSFDCYANDEDQLSNSCTMALIKLFHTFSVILDTIEFADSDTSLTEYWNFYRQQLKQYDQQQNRRKEIKLISHLDANINHVIVLIFF